MPCGVFSQSTMLLTSCTAAHLEHGLLIERAGEAQQGTVQRALHPPQARAHIARRCLPLLQALHPARRLGLRKALAAALMPTRARCKNNQVLANKGHSNP